MHHARMHWLRSVAVLVVFACGPDLPRDVMLGSLCAPGEYHSCTCPWEDPTSTHRFGETHCTASSTLGPCRCDGGPDGDVDAK